MGNPLGQRLRELPGPLLLTGHTGFKGTWMTFLLEHLDIAVVGYSLEAEKDSLFDRAQRTGAIPEIFADVRDYKTLDRFIDEHKPSAIIHMAAQPLVLKSYENPRETFDVNVMGTVNVLDIAFKKNFVKTIIIVTTDKVYRNNNSGRAFVETDPLEGKDPYSASKVGTEAVVSAWQQISKISGGPRVVSVRAGNVIGGGDFAENRIIPDLIRGVMTGTEVEIRNPQSTRPWQHVLDPLSGYLLIADQYLEDTRNLNYNFGPESASIKVIEVTQIAQSIFKDLKLSINENDLEVNIESKVLDLDSSLVNEYLSWKPMWTQQEAIFQTLNWWSLYMEKTKTSKELCEDEVAEFLRKAWTVNPG